MKEKYFSADFEPALNPSFAAPDPSETRCPRVDQPISELERLRDSVAVEPALPHASNPSEWTDWLAAKSQECHPLGNTAVLLTAGAFGGVFGIIGVFFAQHPTDGLGFLYAVLGAPVVEELLKQSGGIYLLEKMPYRIRQSWQLLLVGGLSGLIFSIIENVMYAGAFYLNNDPQIVEHTLLRLMLCTPLHVICSLLAAGGLVRAWRRSLEARRMPQLSEAFGWITVAMVVHALYNMAAVALGPR